MLCTMHTCAVYTTCIPKHKHSQRIIDLWIWKTFLRAQLYSGGYCVSEIKIQVCFVKISGLRNKLHYFIIVKLYLNIEMNFKDAIQCLISSYTKKRRNSFVKNGRREWKRKGKTFTLQRTPGKPCQYRKIQHL